LRQTLASIGGCEVPADLPAELVVVDNRSTDATREVVEQAGLKNMTLRYVVEDHPGKAHALNRGLAEARGEVFVFTDDDVRVGANWIEGMCRPIRNGETDAVAGGVVFPETYERKFAVEPLRSRRAWFGATDGLKPASVDRMIGANMAFSRKVLERVGGFDTELGPGALGFYEETLFTWRLTDAGYRVAARFDIAVEHHFDLSRLDHKNLRSIARRMGESEGYVAWHWGHIEPRTIPRLRRDVALSWIVAPLLRPWTFLSKKARHLDLWCVRGAAYYQQLVRESNKPRRYTRLRRPVKS